MNITTVQNGYWNSCKKYVAHNIKLCIFSLFRQFQKIMLLIKLNNLIPHNTSCFVTNALNQNKDLKYVELNNYIEKEWDYNAS